MTVLERLRKLDAYPKTLEEYRDKTIGGAAGSFCSFNFCFNNTQAKSQGQ